MNASFANKVAVVTGGTRGIGLRCAELLAAGGAKVAVVGIDSVEEGTIAVQKIGVAKGYDLDVTDISATADTVSRIRQDLGEVDVLVCSAGANLGSPKLAENLTETDWDTMFSVNAKAVFFSNQAVATQSMIPRQAGAIVNIASQAGLIVGSGRGLPYATSKAAVIHLTRTLAVEWASYNIRVNAVAPTLTLTDMTKPRLTENPELAAHALNDIPLRRFATVDDIAQAVCFLASDMASIITGITLPVDGGRTSL